jgi:hypothetical protein
MKKILIAIAVLGVAYYAYSKSDNNTKDDIDVTKPTTLTDEQAQSYLDNNEDLVIEWNNGNAKKWVPTLNTMLDWAKWHYANYGYSENRKF